MAPLGSTLLKPPTTAELLLAFRQAKKAQANERTAVGLLDFAAFELDLPSRLAALRAKLVKGTWFADLEMGELVVAPRTPARAAESRDSGVHRVGFERPPVPTLPARLQLTPTPEFSIVEVLYLWQFGPALESLLDDSCVGYRLACAPNGELLREPHSIYRYWPDAFKRYREEPIETAKAALATGSRVQIVSTDVRSFFDCIDPRFMLSRQFVTRLRRASARAKVVFDEPAYRVATASLLAAYGAYRSGFTSLGAAPDDGRGVPIGALVSRAIANAALATLDQHISGLPETICYRRYVDDIVVVSELAAVDELRPTRPTALAALFPGFVEDPNAWRFEVRGLGQGQAPHRFELNQRKTSVHDLRGPHAIEFLGAIQESFSVVTSERRALWGNVDQLEDDLSAIDLFPETTAGQGHVPRLRDSDRFTLRSYRASAFVGALERCAVLLDRSSAQPFVDGRVQKLLAVLDGAGPFDHYELVLALLRVAILLRHKGLVGRLHSWLDQQAGPELEEVRGFTWRGVPLDLDATRRALRSYLRRRRREVVAGVHDYDAAQNTRGRADARRLFATGLRHLDRDTDVSLFGRPRWSRSSPPREWRALRRRAEKSGLRARLGLLDEYIALLKRPPCDESWVEGDEIALFLSIRPPTYSDVSARIVSVALEDPSRIVTDLGVDIETMVDALRGTRYSAAKRRPEARVALDPKRTLTVGEHDPAADVRIALANLPVGVPEYAAALAGKAIRTHERLRVLDNAWREMRQSLRGGRPGVSALFVLPELSIPRLWRRALIAQSARDEISVIAGLEYRLAKKRKKVWNEALGVFATGFRRASVVSWTKRYPAVGENGEREHITKAGLTLATPQRPGRRLVVHSREGRIAVLICSELLEADALADLVGRVELLVVPAWNPDTSSFDYVANAAAGLLVHAFVCIANNAEASDSRVVAPIKEPRFEREWCRIVHRKECRAIWAELPVGELRAFHDGVACPPPSTRVFRPLPPGWGK